MGKRKNNGNYDITQINVASGDARKFFTSWTQKFQFFDAKIYIIFTTCQSFGGWGVGVVGPIGVGGGGSVKKPGYNSVYMI